MNCYADYYDFILLLKNATQNALQQASLNALMGRSYVGNMGTSVIVQSCNFINFHILFILFIFDFIVIFLNNIPPLFELFIIIRFA